MVLSSCVVEGSAESGDVDPDTLHDRAGTPQTELPWGAKRERGSGFPSDIQISTHAKPGEFILQTLFAEFVILAEKKCEYVIQVRSQIQDALRP